jgi:hypothetical protein
LSSHLTLLHGDDTVKKDATGADGGDKKYTRNMVEETLSNWKIEKQMGG